MSEPLRTAITLAAAFGIGLIGCRTFRLLHIPAAAIIGSMVFNAVPAALGAPWAAFPPAVMVAVQAIIGAMLGSMLSPEKLRELRRLALPALLLGVWMYVCGVALGFLTARTTGLDLCTALFASVPAGISEMTSIALEYELNVSAVAMFHAIRVAFAYLTVPFLAQYLARRRTAAEAVPAPPADEPAPPAAKKPLPPLLTPAVALAGGGAFKALGIPGGAIVGSMLCVGLFRVLTPRAQALPRRAADAALILLGAATGMSFTREVLRQLGGIFWTAMGFGLLTFLMGLAAALLLHRLFGLDLVTCVLGCATAGAAQMSMLALDIEGADAVSVSVLHSVRLIIIMAFIPPLILRIL